MPSPIPTLATARLVLRPFRAADAETVSRLINDPKVSATLASIPYPYFRVYADWWISTHATLFAERRELHLAIVRREPDELLGAVALLVADPASPPDLGYWLGRRHWGNGYATEAVGALVRYARRALDVRAIGARCMVDNPASAAVLGKVGFRRIGRCKRAIVKEGRMYEGDDFLLELEQNPDDG